MMEPKVPSNYTISILTYSIYYTWMGNLRFPILQWKVGTNQNFQSFESSKPSHYWCEGPKVPRWSEARRAEQYLLTIVYIMIGMGNLRFPILHWERKVNNQTCLIVNSFPNPNYWSEARRAEHVLTYYSIYYNWDQYWGKETINLLMFPWSQLLIPIPDARIRRIRAIKYPVFCCAQAVF